ncbi:hypothetical protein ILUMI_13293 [Ignelater luminosus]|uniref:Cytochrome b5-related protein n=1 Tax=Ignelater luminosus TaxID=2038154 RepID=A0A8K0GBJ8_IGNLU|nr:hypothetical protein ILUMI_13293 [Ignelater luminosus]
MEQTKHKQFNLLDKTTEAWLQNKRNNDGAEDLWRICDSLYDVSDFIKKHPGGKFWLETTKGTDITEAFESHHVKSDRPEKLLNSFYVRNAKTPRNSPYTFEDDGFYKTLKRRVSKFLKTIPEKETQSSDFYTDVLMFSVFIFAIFSCLVWSYKLATVTGFLCGLTINAVHNYSHKRDNYRMYYHDVCGLSSRDFRIIHILSHHFYPNTTRDVQAYFSDPFAIPFPEKKSFIVKYLSWIYIPLIFFTLAFHVAAVVRFLGLIYFKPRRPLEACELLPLLLPLSMYLISGQSLLATIGLWQIIIVATSFTFSVIAFTNSHIHPEIYIDGDTTRPKDEMDWGINQLDTISDRYEINGNKFLVLVSFGDHALHHLFPTLDHGILHHLYPIALETMKEFNVDIRMMSQIDMSLGYFRRLAKETKNPHPPNLIKAYNT